jgi:integrase
MEAAPTREWIREAPAFEIDARLAEYATWLYLHQETVSRVVNSKQAVMELRGWSGAAFPLAAARIKRFQEQLETGHRKPMPRIVFEAGFVAAGVLAEDDRKRGRQWADLQVWLLMDWETAARPGEVFEARRADLLLPRDRGGAAGGPAPAFLAVRDPKTRAWAAHQYARIAAGPAVQFLERRLGGLAAAEPLLQTSRPKLERRFRDLMMELGVAGMGLTPASVRTGSATEAEMQGVDLWTIQRRLRHSSVANTYRYCQEAVATYIWNNAAVRTPRLEELASLFHEILSMP